MRGRKHLMLSSVALLVLLGCTEAEDGEQAEPKPGKLTGEITVAASGGESEVEALQAVADAFQVENEGTTVVLDTVEEPGDLIAKLTTALLAQTPPDVFVMNYRRLGGLEASGGIQPVADDVDTSGLYEGPVEAFTFDGELACLPSNASSMVVYYNSAVFEEAGVDAPQAGWTWDDMLAKAQELADKGVSAIGFSTELIRLAPFVWSNGGEFVDSLEAPTSVDLSSEQAREAIDFMLDLQDTGMDATDRAGQEPEDAFAAGKIGMFLDSRRAVPGFRGTRKLDFDVASVPMADTATSVLHSDGYCVTKLAENPDVANAFAEYAVLGDGARILAEFGRTVPVNKELAGSPSFLTPGEPPASSQIFLDQLELARPLPHSPTWNEAEEVTEEILSQMFAGELSVDEAIEQIQTETERELARA